MSNEDKKKEFEKIQDEIHKYMNNITDPTIKAFWIYNVWSLKGIQLMRKEMSNSKLIAKFAFGVGITSLAASLLSLGISLLRYGN